MGELWIPTENALEDQCPSSVGADWRHIPSTKSLADGNYTRQAYVILLLHPARMTFGSEKKFRSSIRI
jgi:hypothetical protein